eukprot:m.72850 g.72850  ORF g.72850 m.72850 type:complete len:246 (+) comp13006_c0_seq3:823-1560(+)
MAASSSPTPSRLVSRATHHTPHATHHTPHCPLILTNTHHTLTGCCQDCMVQMAPHTAAYLTSAYWGAFAAGRLAAIFLSHHMSPAAMATADLVGCLVSSILLYVMRDSEPVLWAGSALFGVSMASIFPSAFHLVEHFVDVTGGAASFIVVGAALGEMLVPLLDSLLFERVGPWTFLLVNLIGCIVAAVIFGLFYAWGTFGAPHPTLCAVDGIELAAADGGRAPGVQDEKMEENELDDDTAPIIPP